MIDEILSAYGARFVIAAGGVFLALVILIVVLWIIRNKAPSPFVRGGRSRQPRLQVLDAAAVDTRRRLVLVRRDNVEHLILIGGPTDIVVESGIGEPKAYLAGELAANAALAAHQADEARLAHEEQAALQTPAPKLQNDAPVPQPIRQPVREQQKKAAPIELVMPAAPEQPAKQEQTIAKPAPKPAAAPDIILEAPRVPREQPATPPAPAPATTAEPAAPARAPAVQARAVATAAPAVEAPIISPEPAKPAPAVKPPEPARAEAPPVVVAPAPTQVPPAVRMEEATLVLDTARERVLAPKVEPFAPERFKPPVEDSDMPAQNAPAPRVDPDMESIKSEFEKILDADAITQPAPRPRPTVEPPVARAIPIVDVAVSPKAQSPANTAPASGQEGNLQNEIARIFGEMGEPRKD